LLFKIPLILCTNNRDELYKECVAALQGGLLLKGKDFKNIREALQEAFVKADTKLLNWYAHICFRKIILSA
jgi:hypothetical protein